MGAERKFTLPAKAIALDLIGTLLFLLGAFDLMNARFLGPLSQLTTGYGWPLVVGGVVAMVLGGVVFIRKALATRHNQDTAATGGNIQTVQRRVR